MITELKPNQYIVVGTNAQGLHAGGAAFQAWQDFGALAGCASGPIGGQTWGIVTLDENMEKVPLNEISQQLDYLDMVAQSNPEKEFLLTKIGCGIAGYSEDKIKPLFRDMPPNVILPEGWKGTPDA